ncbi:DUF2809 domain-containing protein [Phycisphaeraceae bacterium D3-23]
MPSLGKQRAMYFSVAVAAVPIGLIARSFRTGADASTPVGFVATYLGDVLWAVLFFFVFAGVLPRWRTGALAGLTLGVTVGIELSQLYHGEPLATLRGFGPTRFLLGTNFLWSDVLCLVVGTAIAAGVHGVLNRK